MELLPGEPLFVCVGGNACRIGSTFDIDNTILVDTDRRTEERSGTFPNILVGNEIVKGEGSGGNINMARACFRTGMEMLGEIILKRPLVIFLADVTGATSVAGAVEMNSLLVRVGLPSVVFLITGGEGRVAVRNSDLMAKALLDGPLRPGVEVVIRESEDRSTGIGMDRLGGVIGDLMAASSKNADVPIPSASWILMRENGGPFGITGNDIDNEGIDKVSPLDIRAPCIAALEVPAGSTTKEINSMVSSIFKDMESISLGVISVPHTGSPWKLSAISPVLNENEGSMDQTGQKRGPSFEELMDSVNGFSMIPETDL